MAINNYIITEADVQAVHVEAQPTVLQGSATQNKQVFDAYPDMIVEHFNGLCNELDRGISPTVDTSVLELYEALGWVAD